MTTENKLRAIINSKNAIKNAIKEKGIAITENEPFSTYADKITSIEVSCDGTGINLFSSNFNPGYNNYYGLTGDIALSTTSIAEQNIPEGFTTANANSLIENIPRNIAIIPNPTPNQDTGYDINGNITTETEAIVTMYNISGSINDYPNLTGVIFSGTSASISNCPKLKYVTLVGNISTITSDMVIETLIVTQGTLDISNIQINSLTVSEDVTINGISNNTQLVYYVPNSKGTIPTGYTSLKYYWIPTTATTINSLAFMGCSALYQVAIPDTVQTINASAFMTCNNLKKIEMYNSTPPILVSGGIPMNEGLIITVPKGSLSAYQSAQNWSSYTIKERK